MDYVSASMMDRRHIHVLPPKGVVALLTVIMLSAILTAIVITVSADELFEREDMSLAEAHDNAIRQSNVCIAFVVRALTVNQDRTFSLPQTVYTDATHTCVIDSIDSIRDRITIKTHAETGESSASSIAEAARGAAGMYEIISWKMR